MPDSSTTQTLLLGHSPDPDDAFMFYGLATGKLDSGRWRFEHILQDIQTLNERALRGELHITAISIHAYPYVADKYALTNCGSSMGDGYGPMVVTREPMTLEDLRGKRIAVPGTMTTAFLALNLCLGRDNFQHELVMFDQILDHVAAGKADAGLIIHEGQLTYQNQKLHCVVDLGVWWQKQTGLPLPLGGNVIRRDLGSDNMREIAGILKNSIQYSLDHRAEAVEHALQYARDMGRDLADRFVGMYVNHWTLDYGDAGRNAIRELLRRGHAAGLVPDAGEIDFV
ncbi:MAG TPA: ABC transporter substrate-binding protein [Phycisphaerae bacterium]|nr:ABC transporter substrate-binding protein [Phycisphaerae bacterium]HOB73345.1 ABC transporter substrate-binding protein [Phycisphaerae bacterium]HOJ55220.1 ABC transporter substrate-binding protein [Phycisphaerae bacterium]HOL24987.1 ABC transporter substrate-binding protein [Phycisphaerae bacterium]HPP20089.1 ABC transporter substrate-binding protein [Phycisphaerae bacterium]